jgi:hypothetical protein
MCFLAIWFNLFCFSFVMRVQCGIYKKIYNIIIVELTPYNSPLFILLPFWEEFQ